MEKPIQNVFCTKTFWISFLLRNKLFAKSSSVNPKSSLMDLKVLKVFFIAKIFEKSEAKPKE